MSYELTLEQKNMGEIELLESLTIVFDDVWTALDWVKDEFNLSNGDGKDLMVDYDNRY